MEASGDSRVAERSGGAGGARGVHHLNCDGVRMTRGYLAASVAALGSAAAGRAPRGGDSVDNRSGGEASGDGRTGDLLAAARASWGRRRRRLGA